MYISVNNTTTVKLSRERVHQCQQHYNSCPENVFISVSNNCPENVYISVSNKCPKNVYISVSNNCPENVFISVSNKCPENVYISVSNSNKRRYGTFMGKRA